MEKIVCTLSGVAFKRSLMIVLLATGLFNMAEETQRVKTAAEPLVIQKSSVFAPRRLGKVDLLHDDDGFHIVQDNNRHDVQNCFVDQGLRKVDRKKLAAFLEHGYISVNKVGDDEFSLKANVRGLGGGPVSGAIAYWVTKSLCYGTAAAAATTAVVATGGTAGAVTGGLVAGATGGIGTGAAIAGGAIAGAGLATEAAVATTGVIASTGSIAGAVAAVESASLGAGALFTAIPFLP